MLSCGAATAQTIDQISATKSIRIGFVAGQAPFASREGGAAPAGYAIDLCGVVAEAIGRSVEGAKPEYVETTIAEAFDAVAAGKIDLLCGAISVTLSRRQLVDFSEPTFVTGMSALLRKDSPRDLRELFMGERTVSPPRSPEMRPFASSRIGVRAGTVTETVLRRAVTDGKYGAEILTFDTHAAGVAALVSRQIDAYFGDRALLFGSLAAMPGASDLFVANRLLTRELYGIGMRRGDPEFRLLVDRALSEFYAKPEFSALLTRYFGDQASAARAQIVAQSIPEDTSRP
jgi:ABC-type amino acid transport substrate-binding protein